MYVDLDEYRHGAAVATALVNTAPEVASGGDQIADPAALDTFLADHGVRTSRPPNAHDVAAVHALRDRLRALITTGDAGELAEHAAALTAGSGGIRLHGTDGRWQWQVSSRPGASPADELALLTGLAAASALRVLGPDRFRRCASPACAGVFIDTSRGGRRRYCEPEVCGNRINVAAYRARRRAGAGVRPEAEA